jgi:hypothetical protein
MNTPYPCDRCAHLYYDANRDDDPDYLAGCKKGYGLAKCPIGTFSRWRPPEDGKRQGVVPKT